MAEDCVVHVEEISLFMRVNNCSEIKIYIIQSLSPAASYFEEEKKGVNTLNPF